MNKPPVTFEEINAMYGDLHSHIFVDGKAERNPVYHKHVNYALVIERIYGHHQNVVCSRGKAKELTVAVIHDAVKAANAQVVERLAEIKKSLPQTFCHEAHEAIEQLIKELTASENP